MRGQLCLWHVFKNCKKLWISFEKGTEEPLRCLDLVTMASVSCTCIISWGEREIVKHSTNKFQMEFSFDNFVSTWAQRPRCPRASSSRTMLSSKCSLLVDSSNLESARTGDCGPWWRCAVPPPARLTAARLSPTTSLTDRATIALSTLVPHGPTPQSPRTGFWQFQRISTIQTRCEAMTEDMVSQPSLLAP